MVDSDTRVDTCIECGKVGKDVVSRRIKGNHLLCSSCYASCVETRVRSVVSHQFARAKRPWSQHVICVAVSGSKRSLALLLALSRVYPASLDRSFRVQPVYVRLNHPATDAGIEERIRTACQAIDGVLPLIVVDSLPEEIASSWDSLSEEMRVSFWRTAFFVALGRVAEGIEHPLCMVSAEGVETLTAKCLELTGSARGNGVACFCSLIDTAFLKDLPKPVPVLRPFGDLLQSEIDEYADVRHVEAVNTDSATLKSQMESVCTGFCDNLQKQFGHIAFTVVSTASKLGVGEEYVRCYICGVPVQRPSDEDDKIADGVETDVRVAEARRVRIEHDDKHTVACMCYACSRMYHNSINDKRDGDVKTMESFANSVTSFLYQQP